MPCCAKSGASRETADTDLVRVFIQKLRRKLGDDPKAPAYIFNHRGVGYRMARSLEPQATLVPSR